MFSSIFTLGVLSAYLDYDTSISIPIRGRSLYLTGYGNQSKTELFWGFPYTANVALTGVVLMYLGSLLRSLFDKYLVLTKRELYIPLGIVTAVIGIITFCVNQQFITNNFVFHLVTMSHAIYGNYLLFLLTSVLLTVTVICLSCLIDNPVMSKYGKHTMEIYAFHPFITGLIGFMMSICHIPDVQGIVISVLTIIVTCAIIPIIQYIDPAIVGVHKK